ncbi:MAG: EamA family transporter [Candidatus Omnitrophica bacterium]|nr:EamA family transporter [Candidatus Omnitrophota bacterium]
MNALWWALLTAVIWGVVPLLEKLGLLHSDPATGVFARSFGVLVGLVVFGFWWSPWKTLAGLPVGSFALLALGGFLASFVGQWAFYHALKLGHLSQVTPIAGAYPLVAAVLGWLLLREPMSPTRLVGAVLVIAGVLLLRR